ncbi:hypothetical protein FNF31_07815 [Cafeteria roenbergensis]|uniref:Dephospho-CoA kinase n=1 Tax=Cafeteria roenbergensis TaxID=33653 RepID=A0A5A8BZT6_CAFRO|nr:hypothetical protein FNF31_07815 [Cafeteria roenbergensis]
MGRIVIGLTGGIGSGKSAARRWLEALGCVGIDADKMAHLAYKAGTPGHACIVAEFGSRVVDAAGEIDRRALGGIVFGSPDARRRLERIVWPRIADVVASAIEHVGEGRNLDGSEAAAPPGGTVWLPADSPDACDRPAAVSTLARAISAASPGPAGEFAEPGDVDLAGAGLVRAEAPRPIVVLEAAVLLEAGWDAAADVVWSTFVDRERAVERILGRDGHARDEAERRIDAQMSIGARLRRSSSAFDTSGQVARTRADLALALGELARANRRP